MSIILKEIRKKNDLTQAGLADKLGVSRSAIAQIELGKNNLSLDLAKKISELFKVSLDDLINNNHMNITHDLYSYEAAIDNSYYHYLAYIQLDLNKIEIAKLSIKSFAKEKGLNPRYYYFNSTAKRLNFNKLKEEFESKSNEDLLNDKFINQFRNIVDACVKAIFEDLYILVSFEYKSIRDYYKPYDE